MGDSIPLHAWEPAVVARDRERTLRVVLPIVAAACAIGAFIIPKGPQAHAFDPYMFGFAGIGLLAVWVLLRQRLMPYGAASALCVMVAGALPAARVLSLFTGGVFDDPRVSLMNSIYAYFPIYFTLLSLLVPFPRSAWLGAGVWLVVAGGTTALTRPYWGDTPVRSGLLPTLALVWAGYPIYLVLVLGAARRHSRMVEMYASKARAAEDANAAAGQNAARFQSIFSLAAVGMAMRDPRGRWLSVNQRVCDITGYSADELLRTDFQSLTHPDDLNADVALAGKVMRGEIPT